MKVVFWSVQLQLWWWYFLFEHGLNNYSRSKRYSCYLGRVSQFQNKAWSNFYNLHLFDTQLTWLFCAKNLWFQIKKILQIWLVGKKDLPKNVQEKSIFCKRLASPFCEQKNWWLKIQNLFFSFKIWNMNDNKVTFSSIIKKNIAKIANAFQVTLWLSVTSPQCHD